MTQIFQTNFPVLLPGVTDKMIDGTVQAYRDVAFVTMP